VSLAEFVSAGWEMVHCLAKAGIIQEKSYRHSWAYGDFEKDCFFT
jgi:uncharacterized membrane protein